MTPFLRTAARPVTPTVERPADTAPPTVTRLLTVARRLVVRARPVPRRATNALVAMLVAAGLVVAGGTGAHAHDRLVSSDPAPGVTLPTAPEAVTLTFSAPALAIGTKVVVRTPDGRDAASGEPELADVTVRQPIDGYLPAGEYTVEWRATSADGHPIDGTFTFVAADETGAPEPTASPTPEPTAEPTATAQPTPESSPTALPTIDPGPRSGGPATFVVGALFAVLIAGVVAVLWSVLRSRRSPD